MASICIPFLLKLESPHTALLQNWRDIVDPPFNAPALLISMQAMILTEMSHLSKAEWLALSPPNVVHGVVKILLDIIRAEGKSSLDQPSDGSVSTTVALSRTQNNLNLATEFLLASPVLVQRARDEESAQSQIDTGTNGLPVEADSSDSVDVLMGEASIAGPSSEIMGDVESSTHDEGNEILATPKALEKLSPRLGPKSTGPDEIKAWMMSTLGKLRDPIRSYFLKRSMDLAESYEGLAFNLEAAFKTFENKPFILDNNKPFDGIQSLIIELQELVNDEQPQHAAALFALIIKLLQKAHLFSDLLEDEDKLRGMIDSKGVVENFDDDDCGGGLVDNLKITVGCCCWSPCLVLLVAFVKQVQVQLVV
ncbi:hypothetical protein PPACK8108_LOCUS21089 [Phakopsora pachyrhizi]|uniref:Uncharacterized protein n=1 Tax=Phakopsora pachyrhizi TaxID=170000 RepID=A0AAV0BIS0_PHAPC|nr:hypothetical protein PPACK8108_LOCUS21089 [Phakopsora pachyrhizi]